MPALASSRSLKALVACAWASAAVAGAWAGPTWHTPDVQAASAAPVAASAAAADFPR